MSCQTMEISTLTGTEFLKRLSSWVKDEKNWKGGKIHKFTFKISELVLQLFEIKAVKKQNPIEELLSFWDGETTSRISWDDAREYLEQENFLPYYSNFRSKRLGTFGNDVRDKSVVLKICFMLTFELARCAISSQREMSDAIVTALQSDRDEDKIDLCKMFPKKENTRIEEERRKNALLCINRRKKMEQVLQINRMWPRGEDPDWVLEILSENAIEREYAFNKLMERKKKYEEELLKQDPMVLEYFKTILSTEDAEDARRAFKQLDKEKKKQTKSTSDDE